MIKRLLSVLVISLMMAAGVQATAAAAPSVPVVYAGSVAAQANAGPTSPFHTFALSETASKKLSSSWSWYVARASGILAAILLAILVLSGVGLLTGLTYRLLEPLPAWAIHRAIGLSFGVLVLIHIFVLLFDKFIGFSLADLLIPFAADYKPVQVGGISLGSFWVAIGVLAFYAMIAVIVSSLFWMQRKPKPWKRIHFASYAILVMTFFHGLFLGTDLQGGIWRFLWIAGAVVVAVSIISRLRRAKTISGGKD